MNNYKQQLSLNRKLLSCYTICANSNNVKSEVISDES